MLISDQSSLRKFLVTGTAWSGGGRAVSMLGNLALSMVLARSLNPSEYGSFYVALSSVVIFAVVAALGMDQTVVRAAAIVAGNPRGESLMPLIDRCLIIAGAGAAIFVGIALLLGGLVPIENAFGSPMSSALLAGWAVAATLQMQLAESYRALGKIRSANVFGGIRSSGILNSVVPLVLIFGFLLCGGLTLQVALAVMLASSCAITIIGYVSLRKSTGSRTATVALTTESPNWRQLLTLTIPLWLAAAATVFHTQGFLWVASTVETPDHVALLAAAQRTVLVLIAPTAIVNAVLPPIIARLWQTRNLFRLQRTVQVIAAVATVPSAVILVAVMCFGPELLDAMFGAYYRDAYVALLVLCFAVSFDIATGSWQLVLAMTGNGKKLLKVTMFGLGLFLAVVPFAKQFPVIGIAVAWGAATIIMNITGLIVARRETTVWCFARLNWGDTRGALAGAVGRLASLGKRA